MDFNKCVEIIMICIIVALLKNQLEQGRRIMGKIGSNENSFKVISVVCGRNNGIFNNMDNFWISSVIYILF